MSNVQTGCSIVEATLGHILPAQFDGVSVRLQLVSTGLQESNFETRDQSRDPKVIGPALGFWQMERGGGVHGVLNSTFAQTYARQVCRSRAVAATDMDAWLAMKSDDLFACGFARLLYFTDPLPLPIVGDEQGAFDYYGRNWRPGAYTRGSDAQKASIRVRWSANYAGACAALGVKS